MRCIGIDIGVTGAVSVIDDLGRCDIRDLPVIASQNGDHGERMVKRKLDPRGLVELIRMLVPATDDALAVIEDIHAFPGARNSPQATGSIMHSRGVVEAVLSICRFETIVVQPSMWKRFYGLNGTKKEGSIEVACSLYPAAKHLLKRKLDHNRAEALLLAHWGLSKRA
jgi:hypothetical protein